MKRTLGSNNEGIPVAAERGCDGGNGDGEGGSLGGHCRSEKREWFVCVVPRLCEKERPKQNNTCMLCTLYVLIFVFFVLFVNHFFKIDLLCCGSWKPLPHKLN